MNSQNLKEANSHQIEEKMSDPLDQTMNTSESELHNAVGHNLESDNMSIDGEEPDSKQLKKEAESMHISTSPVEAPSDNGNHDLDSDRLNSSIYSDDRTKAGTSPSSQSGGNFSTAGRITTKLEENTTLLHGIYEYAASEDETQASDVFYSKFRNSGPHLATLHMFTGRVDRKSPVYVPVYKRNKRGKLLKLMKDWSGRWKYIEVQRLSEDEVEDGLKILRNPKAEMNSEAKKVLRRRTLAALALPVTQPKGGLGWLRGRR